LLDFDPDREDDDLMDEDAEKKGPPELTRQELQKWQKALLEVWFVSS
jgi:hypothetical protein